MDKHSGIHIFTIFQTSVFSFTWKLIIFDQLYAY